MIFLWYLMRCIPPLRWPVPRASCLYFGLSTRRRSWLLSTTLLKLNLALRDILESGMVIPNQLSVLGKLQYADSHLRGRAGKLALADLRELGHTAPTAVRLGGTQVKAFEILRERLCGGKPKSFIADYMQKPALLYP